MAETTKRKFVQITSPKGVFKYPKLAAPDFGTKDYPKPDGVYSVRLILKADDKATKDFIKKLDVLYKEALAEAEVAFKELKAESRKKLGGVKPNQFYTEILDQETEEPTGDIEFRMAMDASGVVKKGPRAGKKWTAKPVIFDAKGHRMANVPDIWGGTVGKIAFEVRPYFIQGTAAAGIKLKLVGAQIFDLVAGGERSAESLGFGEEDGYEHDDSAFGNSSNVDSVGGEAAPEGSEDF